METTLITLFIVVSVVIIVWGIVLAISLNNVINADVDEHWRKQ
jgi:hypothetical protein